MKHGPPRASSSVRTHRPKLLLRRRPQGWFHFSVGPTAFGRGALEPHGGISAEDRHALQPHLGAARGGPRTREGTPVRGLLPSPSRRRHRGRGPEAASQSRAAEGICSAGGTGGRLPCSRCGQHYGFPPRPKAPDLCPSPARAFPFHGAALALASRPHLTHFGIAAPHRALHPTRRATWSAIVPCLGGRDWSSETLSNLPTVTQPLRAEPRLRTDLSEQSLCRLPLAVPSAGHLGFLPRASPVLHAARFHTGPPGEVQWSECRPGQLGPVPGQSREAAPSEGGFLHRPGLGRGRGAARSGARPPPPGSGRSRLGLRVPHAAPGRPLCSAQAGPGAAGGKMWGRCFLPMGRRSRSRTAPRGCSGGRGGELPRGLASLRAQRVRPGLL